MDRIGYGIQAVAVNRREDLVQRARCRCATLVGNSNTSAIPAITGQLNLATVTSSVSDYVHRSLHLHIPMLCLRSPDPRRRQNTA